MNRPISFYRAIVLSLAVSCADGVVRADAGLDFFESKIRPVLVQHCYKCHSEGAGEAKGGLRVDRRESLRAGGESGAAVVPGKPAESLLLDAVAFDGNFVDMPPTGKLPPQVIADVRRWIEMGAPDPRDRASNETLSWDQVLAGRREWWSLQPVRRPPVPPVVDPNGSPNPIDRFLAAEWQKQNVTPAAETDPQALLLRLHFVLTGLPPTPEETAAFVASFSPSPSLPVSKSREGDEETRRRRDWERAYEAAVDRLLASPHFGERWARHWMDLVRYKETHGSEHDPLIPHAWRYRDYLIRALNADVPYDRFVQEHLAGDILPPRRDPQTGLNESPAATTFFRFVEFYPTPVDVKGEEITVVDSQIDAFSKTFQALTVSCARCHDHKFDAVSTRDYYALYGIYSGTRTTMHRLDDPQTVHAHDEELKKQLVVVRKEMAQWWRDEIPKLQERLAAAAHRLSSKPPLPEKLDKAVELDRDAAALRSLIEPDVGDEHSFRNTKHYKLYADFTTGDVGNWFRSDDRAFPAAKSGTPIVEPTGSKLLTTIAQRGLYSHLHSDKHGGSLRSPNFMLDMKQISVLVGGTNNARLRLVIENFQGDDVLFRSVMPRLTNPSLHWETLPIRSVWAGRRAYLELVPRDDMTYTGKVSDASKLPADGRSGIGVRAVVFHDDAKPPAAESTLPEHEGVSDARTLIGAVTASIDAWELGQVDDRQARLLDALLQNEFLPNKADAKHPAAVAVAKYREIESRVPVPTRVPGVADEEGVPQVVYVRGDHRSAGDVVPHRYLEAVDAQTFADRGSGRLALARAVTSRDNPLTARVAVNRLWRHVFGEGLVRSVDNFGQLGETPDHPELLDWLAAEFMEDAGDRSQGTGDKRQEIGDKAESVESELSPVSRSLSPSAWSTKRLLKTMLMSRAFRASSMAAPGVADRDPENRFWSHAKVRRLDAEVIRDRLLSASGRIDLKMYGLGVPLPVNKAVKDFDVPVSGPVDGAGRRSVYLEMRHNYPPPLLSAFDQPRAVETVGRRPTTTVPSQSLALLNDPFVHEQAKLLAARAAKLSRDDDGQIRQLYRMALCREPTPTELSRARTFIDGRRDAQAWTDLAHALFNLKEFIYVR